MARWPWGSATPRCSMSVGSPMPSSVEWGRSGAEALAAVVAGGPAPGTTAPWPAPVAGARCRLPTSLVEAEVGQAERSAIRGVAARSRSVAISRAADWRSSCVRGQHRRSVPVRADARLPGSLGVLHRHAEHEAPHRARRGGGGWCRGEGLDGHLGKAGPDGGAGTPSGPTRHLAADLTRPPLLDVRRASGMTRRRPRSPSAVDPPPSPSCDAAAGPRPARAVPS